MGRVAVLLAVAIATVIGVSVALGAVDAVGKKTLGGRGFATNVTVSFKAPDGFRLSVGVGGARLTKTVRIG